MIDTCIVNNDFIQHPQAIVGSDEIGAGTRIEAFANLSAGSRIGADCAIGSHVFIGPHVTLADRVIVEAGAYLSGELALGEGVHIGAHAVFPGEPPSRSGRGDEPERRTLVGSGTSIGCNASVLAGVQVGKRAIVQAGSIVSRDVPQNAIVAGNPATIIGYGASSRPVRSLVAVSPSAPPGEVQASSVRGVKLIRLPIVRDMRGSLTAAEYGQCLPFTPKRYFVVFDVPSREVRGEHAHKMLHQFLVCIRGSVCSVADDGENREEVVLEEVNVGLYLPPMTWSIQYKYSRNAMLLVLASEPYDAGDYIRDYDEFLAAAAAVPVPHDRPTSPTELRNHSGATNKMNSA